MNPYGFFCFPLTNNLSRGKIASIKSPIEQIGDQKIKIPEKEVTNEAHWRQKNKKYRKKRSPMKPIGILKTKIMEKQISNNAHIPKRKPGTLTNYWTS